MDFAFKAATRNNKIGLNNFNVDILKWGVILLQS